MVPEDVQNPTLVFPEKVRKQLSFFTPWQIRKVESRISKRENRKILPSRLSLLSKKNIRRLS